MSLSGTFLFQESAGASDAESTVASDADQNSPVLDPISYTCGHADGYSDGFLLGCWCASPGGPALVNILTLLQQCCWCPESLLKAAPDGIISANGFRTASYALAHPQTSGRPFVEVKGESKAYCQGFLDEAVHLFMALDLSVVAEHPRLGQVLMALANPQQQQTLLSRAFLYTRAGTSTVASQLLQQAMHEAKSNPALVPRLRLHMTGQVLQLACRHPVRIYEVMAYIDLLSVIRDGQAAARLCEELVQGTPEEGMVHSYSYKVYLHLAKLQHCSNHVGDFFDEVFAGTPASSIAQTGMGNFVEMSQ